MKHNETNENAKTPVKFHCNKCNYSSSKQSEWNRHITTRKHTNETNETKMKQPITTNENMYKCIYCKQSFISRTTEWRHRKKCSMNQEQGSTNIIISDKYNEKNITGFEIDKELLIKMLLKNQEVMEKMIEIMPTMGNISHNNSHNTNTTNNNNTTNNQFNIQMFLNDRCKNAMNLTDFIDTLPITAETYDSTIDNGLTKTITNMITNGLSQLDILERPIHCTDASRKTLYVKEDNVWEKDHELVRILLGIRQIASKQRILINKWKDTHADWNTNDRMQSRFTSLICNSITDIENEEKETNKIIRSISKMVYLDSDMKNQYLE